jgi:CheY-specific phosphatase CheX
MEEVLIDASKEIFEMMAFMEVEKSSQKQIQLNRDETLMGIITFTNSIQGCLSITCSQKCAKSIAVNMLGLDPNDTISSEDKEDALGEITNMVMGSVKSKTQDTYKNMKVSIPTIIKGTNLKNYLGENQHEVTAMLETEEKHLIKINLLFRKTKDN